MTYDEARKMTGGKNKYQSAESRARVREVLMEEWDPIGVRDIPGAEDEYDGYVGKVYVMLMDARVSEQALENYLFETATTHIGMPATSNLMERCARTARVLINIRPEFETH